MHNMGQGILGAISEFCLPQMKVLGWNPNMTVTVRLVFQESASHQLRIWKSPFGVWEGWLRLLGLQLSSGMRTMPLWWAQIHDTGRVPVSPSRGKRNLKPSNKKSCSDRFPWCSGWVSLSTKAASPGLLLKFAPEPTEHGRQGEPVTCYRQKQAACISRPCTWMTKGHFTLSSMEWYSRKMTSVG